MGACYDLKPMRNTASNLSENFEEKFPCSYTENQLLDLINNFINENENDIQESIFKEKTDDKIFELLKNEEKQILLDFFNSKIVNFRNDIQNKLNQLNRNELDFDDLASKLINIEKGEQIYINKIIREINKINNKEDSFKIDYLSIMIVGICGVGKSTLINNFLKLEGKKRAKTGTGKYVTTNIGHYRSDKIPYLRLIDTRGIELNINYGAEAIKNDASNYIRFQLDTGNINNFVSCIWYCITGNRFQQAEEDLLNVLRSSYGDNTIPIIIVYTQAVDKKAIEEMDEYIKERNIYATFIKVLAERKELDNGTFMEPKGLDELLKETLIKCKKAMHGDMRKVMVENISKYIKDILIKENAYIKKYINEVNITNFIKDRYTIKNDKDFLKFIIDIYGNNIKYFFEKEKDIINRKNLPIFKNSQIIKNNYYNDYKKYIIEKTNEIINIDKENLSIKLLDLQAKVEKNNDGNLFIKNRRNLDEFRNSTVKFLEDNFYCTAQKHYVNYIFQNITNHLTESFEKALNNLIQNLIQRHDIIEQIGKCFIKKFDDFESRIKNQNSISYNNNNYNYNYQSFNTNNANNANNANNLNIQSNPYPNLNIDLPNKEEIFKNEVNQTKFDESYLEEKKSKNSENLYEYKENESIDNNKVSIKKEEKNTESLYEYSGGESVDDNEVGIKKEEKKSKSRYSKKKDLSKYSDNMSYESREEKKECRYSKKKDLSKNSDNMSNDDFIF